MSNVTKLPLLIKFNLTLNEGEQLNEKQVFLIIKKILEDKLKDIVSIEHESFKELSKLKSFINIGLAIEKFVDDFILDKMTLKDSVYCRYSTIEAVCLQINIFNKKVNSNIVIENLPIVKTSLKEHVSAFLDNRCSKHVYVKEPGSSKVLFMDLYRTYLEQNSFNMTYTFCEV